MNCKLANGYGKHGGGNCCNKMDCDGRHCKRRNYKKDRNSKDSRNYIHNKYSHHNDQAFQNTKKSWCNNCCSN